MAILLLPCMKSSFHLNIFMNPHEGNSFFSNMAST